LRAIIFDLDGTLIHTAIPFKEMKSRIIEYLQTVGVTPGLLNNDMLNFQITSIAVEDLRRKGVSQEKIRSILSKVSDIMNRVELESLPRASLIESVPETLKAMKAMGLKIGIMTRSCHKYAEKILNKFRLSKFFDAVVARDDVENPKPNPEHAFHLLSLLGVRAEEALYVGDHWSDGECAKKAGLKFVLIKKCDQKVTSPEESGFPTVNSIQDLVQFAEKAHKPCST